MQTLALLAGENIANKNVNVFKREIVQVTDDMGDLVVNLSQTPITNSVAVFAYVNGITGAEQAVSAVAGNEVTLGAGATVQAGDEVEVYYQWDAPSAHELRFTAGGFPPYVFMVGDTLYVDELAGMNVAAQIKYYKAKLQPNFTITFAPTGEPSTLSLTFDVFPVKIGGVDTLYDLVIYEE